MCVGEDEGLRVLGAGLSFDTESVSGPDFDSERACGIGLRSDVGLGWGSTSGSLWVSGSDVALVFILLRINVKSWVRFGLQFLSRVAFSNCIQDLHVTCSGVTNVPRVG